MGYVYLIGEIGNDKRYKIGSTRAKKVETRLKQLQTGNSCELYVNQSFETEHPFKLEKMLHNRFKSSHLTGEWFELSEDDVRRFKDACEECSKVISSLKDNPFYFKKENYLVAEIPLDGDWTHKYNKKELECQLNELTKTIDRNIIIDLYHFNK